MPHRRPRHRGSFASHFDELVVQFPEQAGSDEAARDKHRATRLQEKIDVHRLLFERAWRMDDKA